MSFIILFGTLPFPMGQCITRGGICYLRLILPCQGGSAADHELLAWWTLAQKGLGSNRSCDAVG